MFFDVKNLRLSGCRILDPIFLNFSGYSSYGTAPKAPNFLLLDHPLKFVSISNYFSTIIGKFSFDPV
jgi:hypothetical protein